MDPLVAPPRKDPAKAHCEQQAALTCSSPSHQPEAFLLRMRMSWPFSRFSCSGPDEEWARSTWAISAHAKGHKETLQTSARRRSSFPSVRGADCLPGFFFPVELDV